MNKLFIPAFSTVILLLCSIKVNAQIDFGLQTGGSFSSFRFKETDPTGGLTSTYRTSSDFGFLFGAVAEIPLTAFLSIRPEFNYIQKNFTHSGSYFSSDPNVEFRLQYVEVPLHLVYNARIGSGRVFAGGGLNLAWGINGRAKAGGYKWDIKFDGKTNTDISDQKLHLESMDLGLGLVAGQVFDNGLFATLGYNFGLSNIDPDPEFGEIKTRGFVVKLGYLFGRKLMKK